MFPVAVRSACFVLVLYKDMAELCILPAALLSCRRLGPCVGCACASVFAADMCSTVLLLFMAGDHDP